MTTDTDDANDVDPHAADRRVERLANWVDDLETQLEELREENADLRAELDRVRDDLQQEQQARGALEDEVRAQLAEFDERTSLLARTDDIAEWGIEECAAYCVQKLYTQAREKQTTTNWVDAATAWEDWLDCQIDRTTTYDVFRTAENQTEGDVVEYIDEPRGHEPPSRLVLDLDEGPLPASVGSTPIGRCGASTTPDDGEGGQNSSATAETPHEPDR